MSEQAKSTLGCLAERTFRLFRHLCCTIYSIATVSMLRKATPDAEILEVGSTKYVFIYSQFEQTWSM